MAGRNKQPLKVLEMKGASNHITKEEARKRLEHEQRMRGSTDKVEPPEHFTAAQQREFTEIAEQLIELDIFSNLDVDALARYIDARSEYKRVTAAIKKVDLFEDVVMYTKLVSARDKFSKECRSHASDLGLTITSRLKLVIPETKEKEQKTPGEKRFGGRL